jgi:hypothetical protein
MIYWPAVFVGLFFISLGQFYQRLPRIAVKIFPRSWSWWRNSPLSFLLAQQDAADSDASLGEIRLYGLFATVSGLLLLSTWLAAVLARVFDSQFSSHLATLSSDRSTFGPILFVLLPATLALGYAVEARSSSAWLKAMPPIIYGTGLALALSGIRLIVLHAPPLGIVTNTLFAAAAAFLSIFAVLRKNIRCAQLFGLFAVSTIALSVATWLGPRFYDEIYILVAVLTMLGLVALKSRWPRSVPE